MAVRLEDLMSHIGPALPKLREAGRIPRWESREQLSADLKHGGQLDQLRLMLVSVMLAEEKLGSGRQLRPHARCGTAAIAPIGSS
jgi:hypothetical protein